MRKLVESMDLAKQGYVAYLTFQTLINQIDLVTDSPAFKEKLKEGQQNPEIGFLTKLDEISRAHNECSINLHDLLRPNLPYVYVADLTGYLS